MKDQPRLIDKMRQASQEWGQAPTHTGVPMHDFVTRAEGEEFAAKMATGEWDDLTNRVGEFLPPEQKLKPGERIIGHRWDRSKPYDPRK